jgi:polyisoprenoid-binding protein YceI
MKKLTIALGLCLTTLFASAQTFSVDKAHSKLGFSVVHLTISDVEGSFKITDATLTSSKDDFSDAKFELTADINSVNTDNERRDTHLKSPDFFDAAKFPAISFKSKSIAKTAERKFTLAGDLTMHGVTKPVNLNLTLNGVTANRQGKKVAGFKVTGTLNRTAWGVGSMPAAIVGEEIELRAGGEFIQN